jgi:hypothetical protein
MLPGDRFELNGCFLEIIDQYNVRFTDDKGISKIMSPYAFRDSHGWKSLPKTEPKVKKPRAKKGINGVR